MTHRRAGVGAALALLVQASSAAVTFTWSFGGSQSNPLPQCGTASFQINEGDTRATLVPPFFLYAVPTGALPSITRLSSGTSGSWTVPYAATTQLQLEIVDSAGNEGGWVSASVGAGSSTACIQPRSSTVQLAVNSSTVAPCGTLGVQMGGTGVPPYNLVILPSAGSAFATQNLTLNSRDNYLSFVANISAGNSLLIAGRDSQGNFAPTSSLVSVTGGGSSDCGSRISSSSNGPPSGQSGLVSTSPGSGSATSTAPMVAGTPNVPSDQNVGSGGSSASSGSSSGGSSSNAGAIAGGVVGGVVALLALAALAWFLIRRRRRPANPKHGAQTTFLRPTLDGDDDAETGVRPMSQAAHLTPFDLNSASASNRDSSDHASEQRTPFIPAGAGRGSTHGASSSANGTIGHSIPGSFGVANPDPVSGPSRGYGSGAKASEASAALLERGDSSQGDFGGPVVQHADGGVVRGQTSTDVPPAYGNFVDRQRSLREARI